MTDANEALSAFGPLAADLQEGVESISSNQEVQFTAYVRMVLPLDGYVFWVNGSLVSKGAFYNAMRYGVPHFNQPLATGTNLPSPTANVFGSLHVSTDMRQEETASYAFNRVVFTSKEPIQHLNAIGPNLIFIAEFDRIRFAFSTRGSFYKQSGLWHYIGNAIYSTMESQIIDDLRGFNGRQLIVSNSLPAWLALNGYNPPWPVPLPMPAVPLFPSFAAPQNQRPPYGTVHITPDDTSAIAAAPFFDPSLSQSQLSRDRVTLTLYGCNNDVALTLVQVIQQYAADNGANAFGIMNMPVPRDGKATQAELLILAQRKHIVFDVNYYQGAMREVARQLIETAVSTVGFEGVNGLILSV